MNRKLGRAVHQHHGTAGRLYDFTDGVVGKPFVEQIAFHQRFHLKGGSDDFLLELRKRGKHRAGIREHHVDARRQRGVLHSADDFIEILIPSGYAVASQKTADINIRIRKFRRDIAASGVFGDQPFGRQFLQCVKDCDVADSECVPESADRGDVVAGMDFSGDDFSFDVVKDSAV